MFRTGINFVRVDVIVSDKSGVNIADLKQSDFEVTEDGKPQSIENFKFIKLDGGVSSAARRPRNMGWKNGSWTGKEPPILLEPQHRHRLGRACQGAPASG